MKSLTLLALFFLFTMSSHAQNLLNKADSICRQYHIPEMAYAVVTPARVLTQQVLGHHQLNQTGLQDTARLTDYFHLGSNTKAITSFIAAYLVEQNKISWDTRFFDLYPEWKAQSDPAYYTITLKDLLSHRAHVQPFTSGAELLNVPKAEGTLAEQRKQFAAYVLKQKPVIADKDNFSYSNAGYSVAAQMLEKVSGSSWEQLVELIIHQKLGLHAKFGWPNLTNVHQPWGHWDEGGKQIALPPDIAYNLKRIEPAGDISMTLPDYVRFIQLHMQGLAGKSNLLKAGSYELMHYGMAKYALGWGNVTSNGKKLSDHAGSAGTFYCYCLIDSKKNKAYIVMVNSGTAMAQRGLFGFVAQLVKAY